MSAHHHHHHSSQSDTASCSSTGQWNYIIAIFFNLFFVVIEAIYAYSSNSMSLLADAGHNLGDVLGLFLAFFAVWLLRKKATDRYSYGFKRTTILAAIANASILVVTTIIIIYESIHKVMQPQPLHETQVMIVAAIGIVINGCSALLFLNHKHDLNTRAAFLHLAYDAMISLGVVITALLIKWTHLQWLDPMVGMIIAVIILYGSWGLMRDSLNLIMDAVPANIKREQVADYLKIIPGVKELHHLHIWALSTKEVALTAHLVSPQGLSDQQLRNIHDELRRKFLINHATIQVERGDTDSLLGCSRDECNPHTH